MEIGGQNHKPHNTQTAENSMENGGWGGLSLLSEYVSYQRIYFQIGQDFSF